MSLGSQLLYSLFTGVVGVSIIVLHAVQEESDQLAKITQSNSARPYVTVNYLHNGYITLLF